MGLAEYNRKRDFKKSAEPAGKAKTAAKKSKRGGARFVIQKHDATRLHYDFRLEMDGVLKSWAVPKGLPWTKGEKHLAVEVEDHPMDYADFEGIIPKGQYGGGTVMVWDRGTYEAEGDDPLKALKAGRLHLHMNGDKAQGEWTLIRMRRDEAKPQWLLLKSGEAMKPLSKKRDDESVKTGRSMKQIAEDQDAEWQSNRADEKPTATSRLKTRIREALKKKGSRAAKQKRAGRKSKAAAKIGAGKERSLKLPDNLPKASARFIEPMKPRLMEAPPPGEWMYEIKFDGIRAEAIRRGGKLALLSRNQNELAGRFPEVVSALLALKAPEFVIDGEVVALDENGRSSFQLLQALEMEGRKAPLYYYAFDLLQADGRSLVSLPLEQRKKLLSALLGGAEDPIRQSSDVGEDADPLLKEVKRLGLEGIVGKLRQSVYEPGRRSGAWVKLKSLNEQEFVIGGFTPPAGARKYFGAILVGYFDKTSAGKSGRVLRFAGKVGTGFNSRSLAALRAQFKDIELDHCPFVDLPTRGGGLSAGEVRRCTWVKPELVAQIKFSEWTRDGKLRPVYLGLREDKQAQDVVREG